MFISPIQPVPELRDADRVVAALRAAGEQTRLRALALLTEGELAVGELAQALGQSQPRVSRHLKLLTEAGLVERAPEGAWVFYRLPRAHTTERQFAEAALAMLDPSDPLLARDLERLSEIRAARDEAPATKPIDSLDALSLDIARMLDHDAVVDMWERYRRGEQNVFDRRLYTPQGGAAFDEIRRRYRGEREFRDTVDRYIQEFERLLSEVARDDRDGSLAKSYLVSDTGKVYTMLAHAAQRFE